ncbi:MAG TPA: S24 family peptidase [Thermoanaerobaculia bacterium]|nr:S24 family peptidase [Thermoanaerobaculia bacterium]
MRRPYGEPARHLSEPNFAGGTVGAMTLGERLRAAIDAKGKSHAWVAEEVGITPASLSAILTGKTADPSFFTVLAIARAIEEPLSAIVDDPLVFWNAEELGRLGDIGGWLVERTTRERAGQPLGIPPRKKFQTLRTKVHPVAATSGGVLDPDAFELSSRRIPPKYARMRANAVFSVSSESMTGEGIFPGDLLYVHRTPETGDALGRIVVCTLDEMILVKRIRTRGRKLVLESANPAHEPMVFDENSSRFRLIGIVVGTSRT